MSARKRKQTAKEGKPRIVVARSSKVLGTSSETTRRVSANPKTASLKDSSRVTSRPRRRKPSRNSRSCFARAARNMSGLITETGQCDKHADRFGLLQSERAKSFVDVPEMDIERAEFVDLVRRKQRRYFRLLFRILGKCLVSLPGAHRRALHGFVGGLAIGAGAGEREQNRLAEVKTFR